MRWQRLLSTIRLRGRSIFRRAQTDQELRDELQYHLELQIEENLFAGMTSEEARRSAIQTLGCMTQLEEECRETRGVRVLEDFVQDLRYGFRQMRRSPGFSALAVPCLTLGIGANAAVFSWIEGILLRPFPAVAHQERMVALVATKPSGDKKTSGSGFQALSWPDLLDFRRNCTMFDSLIVSKIMGTTLSVGDRAERVVGSVVSANYFEALGVRPILGRGFQPEEDFGRNAHPVAVISYWMWKDRFNLDPQIVGKTQMLNGVPHTIVGVAPENFVGTFVGYPMGFWVPTSMQETFVPGGYKLEDRGGLWIEGYAMLKPGVSIEQAQQEISAVAKRLEADYLPTNRGRGVALFPLSNTPFSQAGNLRPTLEITQAVVFLVLLIACANVGSLLLVRSLARRHEMSVRLAVGARRGRLVKQLLTEGLILSTLSAAGGLLVAYWCRNALAPIFTPSSVTNLKGEIDWRVFVFSIAVCVISTLMFGLVPALQTSKTDLSGALKAESPTSLGGREKSRVRSGLVLMQVSLSFILVVGAILLLQSLQQIRTAEPGFSTDNVVSTGVDLVNAGYDLQRAKNFQDALIDRVKTLGGAQSASWTRVLPFSYIPYFSAPIAVDGYTPAAEEQPEAEYNQVGPGYFETMGIPLVSGREFTIADNETAPLVAIVNEKMSALYWQGNDPVGRRLRVRDKVMTVVGVAKQAKYASLGEAPRAFFYVPHRQDFARGGNLIIRTSQDAATMGSAITREVRALDANLAIYEPITVRKYILRSALSSQQIAVTLLAVFGSLALLLAAVGLYAVMSFSVSQSTRDLAVRMALGARASDVLRLVMSHGLALTAGGVVLGGIAALALTRLIAKLLYNVNPRDPLAFGMALAAMTIASLAACFLPALRAARTDPVRALRQ